MTTTKTGKKLGLRILRFGSALYRMIQSRDPGVDLPTPSEAMAAFDLADAVLQIEHDSEPADPSHEAEVIVAGRQWHDLVKLARKSLRQGVK